MSNGYFHKFIARDTHVGKGILALLLIVSMMFSYIPQANASVDPVIRIGTVSGEPGTIVEVPVSYDPNGSEFSFYRADTRITYDASVLQLVEVVLNEGVAKTYTKIDWLAEVSDPGSINTQLTTRDFIDVPTVLYSLHFKIIDGAAAGDSSVSIRAGALFADTQPVIVSGEAGKVTVVQPVKPLGNANIAIGSASGKAGDKVTVTVNASSLDQAVGSYGIRLRFNPAVLQVESVTGDFPNTRYKPNNNTGSLIVAWSDDNGGTSPIPASKQAQKLFTVQFVIAPNVATGDYALKVEDVTLPGHFTVTDTDAVEMVKSVNEGKVTVIGESVTPPLTPSNPGSSGGSSTTSPPASTSEKITVNVTNERNANAVVSATIIERTTGADGRKKDEVNLTAEQTSRAIESLKKAGSNIARIMIPDEKDEVSELNVKLPAKSTSLMADEKINLYIETDNASLQLPANFLQGLGSDIFFHLVPIKDAAGREEVEQRIQKDPLIVKPSTNTADFRLVGRPMTIETNMSSRPVTVVLPIRDTNLTQKELDKLQVFIEHSDGTKELVEGKIVKFNGTDQPGIEFEVTKFSTFSIILMNSTQSSAYIQGYADGTFRPDQAVKRVEMAALLSRVFTSKTDTTPVDYSDMPVAEWARESISLATTAGYMQGNDSGSFMPERSITRAEMAVIVDRILDNHATDEVEVNDIAQHWGREAIQRVLVSGIMTVSSDSTFRPNDALTRAEAVTLLNRLLNREPVLNKSGLWKDVSSSHWAFGAIQAASVK
ncbi:S-layer homology domain-containing protein [Paenibacillus sp. LS1]|uniref:S-layer homology domain-containing protein n=1 Tax=Paenibacillus sp. LS1 TaxID=2992120 RepID=UPI00222E0DE0|nr:S-layer homology domain-containing protein [Paenibacillus sp. LS1]MCW3791669.1 S-layer homology domain-containing protein [Paenibacillus sp. LS1]